MEIDGQEQELLAGLRAADVRLGQLQHRVTAPHLPAQSRPKGHCDAARDICPPDSVAGVGCKPLLGALAAGMPAARSTKLDSSASIGPITNDPGMESLVQEVITASGQGIHAALGLSTNFVSGAAMRTSRVWKTR
jgi:hypothetical protein